MAESKIPKGYKRDVITVRLNQVSWSGTGTSAYYVTLPQTYGQIQTVSIGDWGSLGSASVILQPFIVGNKVGLMSTTNSFNNNSFMEIIVVHS